MLPDFTEDGLLPAGIHPATLEEFAQRFVFFGRSDRRFRVFDGLRELYRQSSQSGIVKRFLVGGSFVTSTPEPNDFDCILVLDRSIVERELRPMEYNLASRRMARRIFGGDIVPVIEGTELHREILRFFQFTRNDYPMGIVEIAL